MKNIIILVSILFIITGCSNQELTRKKAQNIIEKYYQFPNYIPINIIDESIFGRGFTKDYQSLINQGYLNYQKRPHSRNCDIIITEKSSEYYAAKIPSYVRFIGCDVVFNEISGIKLNDSGTKATVYYSLRYTNITPFGRVYNLKEGHLTEERDFFELYDDGWRIKESEKNFLPKK